MPLSFTDFEFVQALLARHAAIVLSQEKNYLAESRLLVLARREGFASPAELIACLRRDPSAGLGQKVIETMTTNETSFFRDSHPFEALRRDILPALLARRAEIVGSPSGAGPAPLARSLTVSPSCYASISRSLSAGKCGSSRRTYPRMCWPGPARACFRNWK